MKHYLAIIGIVVVLSQGRADAQILNTYTYDLNNLYTTDGGIAYSGVGNEQSITPFTVHVGDTLVTTINFMPGQSITLNNGNAAPWGNGFESLTLAFENNGNGSGSDASTTSQLVLFTSGGNVTYNGSYVSDGVLAQTGPNDLTSSSIQFTGFKMTTTVNTLSPTSPETVNQVAIWGVISGHTVLAGVTTPEPETWALLLSAMGMLIIFRKRKSLQR